MTLGFMCFAFLSEYVPSLYMQQGIIGNLQSSIPSGETLVYGTCHLIKQITAIKTNGEMISKKAQTGCRFQLIRFLRMRALKCLHVCLAMAYKDIY